jgi:hypothetical protein
MKKKQERDGFWMTTCFCENQSRFNRRPSVVELFLLLLPPTRKKSRIGGGRSVVEKNTDQERKAKGSGFMGYPSRALPFSLLFLFVYCAATADAAAPPEEDDDEEPGDVGAAFIVPLGLVGSCAILLLLAASFLRGRPQYLAHRVPIDGNDIEELIEET